MTSDVIMLYHGSIADFGKIDIKRGRDYKDFGKGFYCSETRSHAVGIAIRNHNIEVEKNKANSHTIGVIHKWLYTYEFPRSALSLLSVKVFELADKTWLEFVSRNRRSAAPLHDYDIVIGPTANDRTNASIQVYFSGGYGTVGANRAMEILLEVLVPEKLPAQTYFASERAVSYLKLVRKERL